jgi:hypothetical protein
VESVRSECDVTNQPPLMWKRHVQSQSEDNRNNWTTNPVTAIRLPPPPFATSSLNEELMLSVGPIVKEKINILIEVFRSGSLLFNDTVSS